MRRRIKNKMKELTRAELKINGSIPVFLHQPALNKVVDGLKWCCEKRGLRIYDYCILPDRILLIADAAWGSPEETIYSFQSFSAKAIVNLLQFQRNSEFIDQMLSTLRSEEIFWEANPLLKTIIKQEQHDEASREILNRPVKMGWVTKAEHYRLSSEHPKHPLQGWIVEGIDPWS